MANYSAYIPAIGSTTYATQISNFILVSATMDTEVETARDGETNLLAKINLKVKSTGDTLTGDILLNANPTSDLHAASRGYITSTYLPLTGGNLSVSLSINSDVVAVKDVALTSGNIISADANGYLTTTLGITTANLLTLSGTQTITGVKTFSSIPAFNGGTSGSTSPFSVDSDFVVTNLNADLLNGQEGAYYAPIDSPAFTETPSLPTGTIAVTQTLGDDATKVATTAFATQTVAEPTYTIDWISPEELGTPLSVPTIGDPVIAALSTTEVAFIDDTNNQLRMYEWNGKTWTLSGTGYSWSIIGESSITALNSTDIVIADNGLQTFRWSGSSWSTVGNQLTVSTGNAIVAISSTEIAYIDSTNDELRTYEFDGTDWSQAGSGLYLTAISSPAFTALTSTEVAFVDTTNDELRTYHWSGSAWSLVGSGLTLTALSGPSLAALNSTDVVAMDYTNNYLRIYRFDGSTWSLVSEEVEISGVFDSKITVLNGTDIAFIDGVVENLTTYRFAYSLTV